MFTNVAYVLAGLIGAGCILLGANALRAPQVAAGFGIPDTPVEDRAFQAWLSVKAVRDIASGIFILILLVAASPDLLGWFLLAAAGIPVGDAFIVWRSNGPKMAVYGVHGATAAVIVAIGVLLLVA
ncbi:MAG TPA: DUF4267 domain-containing protein [Micromonosporaceae bacterium]|nr:DUF4267 domain-containing protein [Micromonosporaceae bacterium]